MARMIPPVIHPDVRSQAERQIFNRLHDAPGTDRWVCLHSLGLARHTVKRRGEIDFLVMNGKGVFVLEVKGGRVGRHEGIWTFTDRYNRTHQKTESPFDQAGSAMFAVERDVRNHFGDSHRLARVLFGFGVMFPDIVFDEPGPDSDSAQVYDRRDRRRPITAYFDRLASFTQSRQPSPRNGLTQPDIDQLAAFLRGDFDVIPALTVQSEYVAAQMLRLTTDQYGALDAMSSSPRCIIHGCAGTGKTLLAVEAARREAQSGARVLLLCYNRLLAEALKNRVTMDNLQQQIVVTSVYQFFERAIRRSTLAAEFEQQRQAANEKMLFRELYPEYAALALLEETPAFQALVVDEAQDMLTSRVLDALDVVLEGGFEAGRWRIFLDPNNQAAVYGAIETDAYDRIKAFGDTTTLVTNCRNTKQIENETVTLTGPAMRAPARINGQSVEYAWYSSEEGHKKKLLSILHSLLKDGAAPGQITVLSFQPPADSCAAQLASEQPRLLIRLAPENITDLGDSEAGAVTYCSVSAFKGLENDFIVLTGVNGFDSDWARSVLYVGMSRARAGLHLLMDTSLREAYQKRIKRRLRDLQFQSEA